MIVNIDEVVDDLFRLCIRCFLSDNAWQVFGYKKRPKRGKFIRKFFSKNTIAFEDMIVEEIFILALLDVKIISENLQNLNKKNDVDYRMLILCGLIERAYRYELINDFKAFFSSVQETFQYLKLKSDAYEGLLEKFERKVFIDKKRKTEILMRLIPLFIGRVKGVTFLNYFELSEKMELLELHGNLTVNLLEENKNKLILFTSLLAENKVEDFKW